jgi:DNA-binding NarL/FixJ family response regulator
MTTEIAVAIVEDDPVTREGLELLIGRTPGFRCTATFGSVEAALHGLAADAPHLVLLDVHLPGVPGSVGVRWIRDRYADVQVVMLTVLDEEERIFESLCNGACGYLLKRTAPKRLIEALREAHLGGSPMTPDIARKVVNAFRQPPAGGRPTHDLTPHEVRILQMLAKGDSYSEIGDALDVTVNTVRFHIRRIYEKLQVHTKSEAVSKAIRQRLIN